VEAAHYVMVQRSISGSETQINHLSELTRVFRAKKINRFLKSSLLSKNKKTSKN
jgi:hypothetical protein